MLDIVKNDSATVADRDDITLGELVMGIAGNEERPLIFYYNGRPVKPGYHVTEVKAGQFAALDCGANAEAWTELFVQLWDVNEDEGRTHMPARKFAAIVRKVADLVALDATAKLTFEVSDGVVPMQLFRAAMPALEKGEIRIHLSPRPASCKPRDRWLEEQKASTCCTAAEKASACCG